MEQAERLEYMLDYLISELPPRERPDVPHDYAARRGLFRALANIRPPRPVSAAFLGVQDAFLREENRRKGIVGPDSLPSFGPQGKMLLWHGDITRLAVDAIVNAANSALLGCFMPGHHCIDNAVHTAAGVQLREECHAIMTRQGHPEAVGTAKVTRGYNLPCRFVIHTVGPQVAGQATRAQEEQLASCYAACLREALARDLRSLAFCCISTGVFAFPRDPAATIAVRTVCDVLTNTAAPLKVVFAVFSKDDDRAIQMYCAAFERRERDGEMPP